MEINEAYRTLEHSQPVCMTVLARSGEKTETESRVLREHLMDVYINETLTMKLVCTPELLSELVLGRLLSEGIITGTEQVELVYICAEGRRARVLLKESAAGRAPDFQPITPTCCTGNQVLSGDFLRHRTLKPLKPIPWTAEQIFALADQFSADTPLHRQTGAAHSCYLARDGVLLFSCEDIGRHNALDKALGYGLRHNIPLGACTLYTSGRVPIDMAEKAIRAGVPILCTKASPTAEAVALAEEYHLTLIGARKDRLRVYAGTP